jgi:hypothetical protein
MNKICKEYIKEIKAMFPVKGKQERNYIKNLSKDIESYCEEVNVSTKEELYENYGNPIDVVAEYFSATGVSCVIKKLRISKYIKALIAIIIAIILVLSTIYAVFKWQTQQMALREEMVGVEEVIE